MQEKCEKHSTIYLLMCYFNLWKWKKFDFFLKKCIIFERGGLNVLRLTSMNPAYEAWRPSRLGNLSLSCLDGEFASFLLLYQIVKWFLRLQYMGTVNPCGVSMLLHMCIVLVSWLLIIDHWCRIFDVEFACFEVVMIDQLIIICSLSTFPEFF